MKKPVSILLAAVTAAMSLSCAFISADASTIKGDVNGDNTISLRDATLIQKIDVGLITPTADQKYSADFDGDGIIGASDSLFIQKYVCLDVSTLTAFAPNKSERINFIDAVNADRIANGVTPFDYNDAMLEAGNIRAKEYLEYPDTNRPNGAAFYTVLEECNLTYRSGTTPYQHTALDDQRGAVVYSYIKEKMNSEDQIYSKLMSAEYRTICVGSVRDTSTATGYRWIIILN